MQTPGEMSGLREGWFPLGGLVVKKEVNLILPKMQGGFGRFQKAGLIVGGDGNPVLDDVKRIRKFCRSLRQQVVQFVDLITGQNPHIALLLQISEYLGPL